MPGKKSPAKLASNVKKLPPIFSHELEIVGLGFRLKRDVREVLAAVLDKSKVGGIDVKLVREQENKYDVNAIKVMHAGAGQLAGKHLGYVRAETAAILAPHLDNAKDGGLTFKAAKLIRLYENDDNKTGYMTCEFYDWRKTA